MDQPTPTGPPPVHRHRAPPRDVRTVIADLGNRLGVAALVLAAVAIGGVIKSHDRDVEARERPYVHTGAIGDQVSARIYDVTVLGVRGATTLKDGGKTYQTDGIWVVVKVRAIARADPCSLGFVAVRDRDGVAYRLSTRVDQSMDFRELQPGIPVTGELVFEVPRPAARGLAVRFSGGAYDQRMDAMAEVSLDLQQSTVDAWLAAEPLTPADPEADG
jgi:hypothetical protein